MGLRVEQCGLSAAGLWGGSLNKPARALLERLPSPSQRTVGNQMVSSRNLGVLGVVSHIHCLKAMSCESRG